MIKINNQYWAKGFVYSFFFGSILSVLLWFFINPLGYMSSTPFREGFMLPAGVFPISLLILTILFILSISLVGMLVGWIYGRIKNNNKVV